MKAKNLYLSVLFTSLWSVAGNENASDVNSMLFRYFIN